MKEAAKSMREYVYEMHAGQVRQDGTPAYVHAVRVCELLTAALSESDEAPDAETLADLQCAALGHDLLEDTRAAREKVLEIAGQNALAYIDVLTNQFGEDRPAEYARQVSEGQEEARMIKLADLCDNLIQASISIGTLGSAWMRDYFLPIVTPMIQSLESTRFDRYPRTANTLIAMARLGHVHLTTSLALYSEKPWGEND